MDQEKKRKDFQYGFPIGTILAFVFYLQVTPMLPTKFQVDWLFGPGEEAKNVLLFFFIQYGRLGGYLGFPIEIILAIFYLQVTPMLPTKFRVNWPRGVGGVGF